MAVVDLFCPAQKATKGMAHSRPARATIGRYSGRESKSEEMGGFLVEGHGGSSGIG
jgi:hypothetical protein